MTVNTIPVETKCGCKNLSVRHDYNSKKIIYSGSCNNNENCECKKSSSIPDKHNEMKRLELTADLLTGISEIDHQHRELFTKGNAALFPDTVEPKTIDFADALVFLSRYVDYHFLAEEDAMERCGYDRVESHKKQHRRLREDLIVLLKRLKKEGPTKHLKLKFHYMFSDWLTYHIKRTDRAFAEFLREHGSHVFLYQKKYHELRKFGIPIDDLIGDADSASVTFVNIPGIDGQA